MRYIADGCEREADPRHAELVIEQLGLDSDSGVVTPGVSGADEEDNGNDLPVFGEDITRCRDSSQHATTSELTDRTPSSQSKRDVER